MQAAFRCGKSIMQQIFVSKNIIEQSIGWNTSLQICSIESDGFHRFLWRIVRLFHPNIIKMIQATYRGSQFAVVDRGKD